MGARWTVWALGSGTTVSATPLDDAPGQLVPKGAAAVAVLAGPAPAEPHVELVLLEARQGEHAQRSDRAALIECLREKAGELGCDALLLARGAASPDALVARAIVYVTHGSGVAAPLRR